MQLIPRTLWVGLIVITAGAFLFFDARRLPNLDEARELAIGTFERYAKDEKIDQLLFDGPVEAPSASGAAYTFQWTYVDKQGRLTVLVSVDRGAWTHLSSYVGDSYDGSPAAIDEIKRLEQYIRELSRARE